jgi:hypothetical protein
LPRQSSFRPRLELLENRTVPSAVTLSTVTAQPTGALSSGTYVDIPGLSTTASAGLFDISASVNIQNTAATAATEVGVELLVNSAVVDARVLSFAPGSNTLQNSITVEADVTLTANEKIEAQATVLGSSGSAQFPGTTQALRLIQFNANPDSSPGVVFTNVTALPTTKVSSSAYSDVPGLTTPAPAGGLYHVSASVNVQNTSLTAGTEVGVELLANSQVMDARVLSFAPGTPTAQQSITVQADLAMAANENIEVQTTLLNAGGSAQYPGTTQTLHLIQFKSNPDHSLGAAFTAVTAAPGTALTANAYVDVPGLATAATAAGNYHLSASVDLQNTPTTPTQVGIQLVANGIVLDSRVVSFGANTNTFEQSITVDADVALTANENVEVQATVLGAGGSAQFPGTTQTLHMIQFIPPPITSVDALVADFPGNGVWRHSDAAGWLQLSPAEASLVAVDDHGNVAAVFGNGLWRYEDAGGWQNLSPAMPSLIDIAGNGIVVGEFPSNGVWRYGDASAKTESWLQLTPANALSIAVDDQADTVGSFQGNGVYLYQDTVGWQQLTPAVATQVSLAASGGSLAASFQGGGAWRYTLQASGGVSVGWQQLTTQAVSALAVDSAGGVLCAKADGLWLFPQTGTGQQLTPAVPSLVGITSDGEIFAEFPPNGLWEYNSGWQQVTPADAKLLR